MHAFPYASLSVILGYVKLNSKSTLKNIMPNKIGYFRQKRQLASVKENTIRP
jgi:hypothetical protein